MSEKRDELLKRLKHLQLEGAQVRLFFLKRRLVERKLSVTVLESEITKELGVKLARAIKLRLAQADSIANYSPLTVDQDDSLLIAPQSMVNWQAIHRKIKGDGTSARAAKDMNDLRDCDFYVVEFDFASGHPLYAAKRLPEKLSINRIKFDQWLFKGGKLESIDDGKFFNVIVGVDFLNWGDHILIVEKRVFEALMNIREGMVQIRDELITALEELQLFDGVEKLKSAIADNAHMLRRATQVKNARLYTDREFVQKLFEVVQQYPAWGIQVKNGKIVVTPENTDGVLSLLNDARAESLIKREVFDAIVKKTLP